MSRIVLPALAAAVLVTASLLPNDASAQRYVGGPRGGGFHGDFGYRGPIVGGRVGYVGRPAYRGYYPYRGYAYGYGYGAAAAAVTAGAAAAAYGYYNDNCGYDLSGRYFCRREYD